MLFLFLVHSLSTRAAPIPAVNYSSIPSSCEDIGHCRTLLGIVWSCITTILLCTWVAIHPNVPEPEPQNKRIPDIPEPNLQDEHVPDIPEPKPQDRRAPDNPEPVATRVRKLWDRYAHKISSLFQNKIPLFICALLVPEYILAWAIRQHLMARRIAKEHGDLGLTQTHGFFIIMGGFHCFTGSDKAKESYKPEHPLPWGDVISLLEDNKIGLPTEEEIRDRSKSDWFAKTFVLLQTLWFVMQCIARHIEHLPTTELEIVTLAYTTINFGIFLAWLDKPRNVECPIRVFQQPYSRTNDDNPTWIGKALMVIIGVQDEWVELCQRRKVPVFYSGNPDGDQVGIADSLTLTAGIVFGAIHCIAWSFDFATTTQVWLWRLSAVSITAIPALFLSSVAFLLVMSLGDILDEWLGGLLRRWVGDPLRRWVGDPLRRWVGDPLRRWVGNPLYRWVGDPLAELLAYMFIFCPLPLGLLYITARVITVVLAFINLSSLPPGAFETVHWTTLIPHL